MYIYRRTILKLNWKITARQIKRFKVLYSSFFSLTSDSLQTISVSKYKSSRNIDIFRFNSNVLLLSKVGSLWVDGGHSDSNVQELGGMGGVAVIRSPLTNVVSMGRGFDPRVLHVS
jgi:hypothetical protein